MSQPYRGKSGGARSGYRSGAAQPRRKARGPKTAGALVVLGLVVIAVAGVLYMMHPSPSRGANANLGATATHGDQPAGGKYANGVYVDDVSLGGLTRSEAEQQIKAKQDGFTAANGVTVTDGSKTVLFKIADTDYSYNTSDVLDEAYQAGRDGADLSQNPVKLTTKITVDPGKLQGQVKELAAPYYKAPVDAAYTGLDPNTHKPIFSPDAPGQQVDEDALWASVKKEFTDGTFGAVQIQVEPLQANITLQVLQGDLQLFQIDNLQANTTTMTKLVNEANAGHTYTTQITDSSDGRLANIKLAGNAVSGLVMPGEEFDFNKLTGDRTAEQGYQLATVDISGRTDKGLGGGVCQVSGTMYNAVIRYGGKYEADGQAKSTASQPGLAVTSRDSHSVQSGYLRTGTDCTVDIKGKKDLKFRNDFDKPVLIVMYYEKDAKGKYFEHCDIYGPALPDGAKYDLVRKNVTSLKTDNVTINTVYSKYAPIPGKLVQARKGTRVDIYISKTLNGVTTETKIYTDKYDPEPAYWYINPKDPNPPGSTGAPTENGGDITPPPSTEQAQDPAVQP